MSTLPSNIVHLIWLGNIVIDNFKLLEKLSEKDIEFFSDKDNLTLRNSVYSQILISTDSFLDEYNNHFISSDKSILEFKAVVKPLIDRIKRWDGLKDFRNNVLTHPLRIRKEGHVSVLEKGAFNTYNIPNTFPDLLLLSNCITFVVTVLHQIFKNEFEVLREDFLTRNISESKSETTIDQVNLEFNSLRDEANKIAKKIIEEKSV